MNDHQHNGNSVFNCELLGGGYRINGVIPAPYKQHSSKHTKPKYKTILMQIRNYMYNDYTILFKQGLSQHYTQLRTLLMHSGVG